MSTRDASPVSVPVGCPTLRGGRLDEGGGKAELKSPKSSSILEEWF